jgi:hypothetical protein
VRATPDRLALVRQGPEHERYLGDIRSAAQLLQALRSRIGRPGRRVLRLRRFRPAGARAGEDHVLGVDGAGPRHLIEVETLTRVLLHRRRDVGEQLGQSDAAVAVTVGRPLQPAQQVVGEQAVPELLRLDRLLTPAARRQQEAVLPGQLGEHRRLDAQVALTAQAQAVGRQHAAGVTAVEADDDGAGVEPGDPPAQVAHRDAFADQLVRVGVVREEVAFVVLDDAVPGEVDEGDVHTVSLPRQPLRQGADDAALAGLIVGQQLDPLAREVADLGVNEQPGQRLGVARGVAEEGDAVGVVICADPDQ